MKKFFVLVIFVSLTYFCFGASLSVPRQSLGFHFGCIWKINFFGHDNLDKSLNLFLDKKVGLGYTLKGGFIDTNHFGESLDWTFFYYNVILENLCKGADSFFLETNLDSSKFLVEVSYLDSGEDCLKEFSCDLASFLAFKLAVFHEILTFYGYKSTGIFSEAGSAFSPEDLYSDLLGCIITRDALKSGSDFESEVKSQIKKWMNKLILQDSFFVKKELEILNKSWYQGVAPFNELFVLNLDIGCSGFLSPCLVVGEFEPFKIPVPNVSEKICHKSFLVLDKKQAKLIGSEKQVLDLNQDFCNLVSKIYSEANKRGLKVCNF